MYANAHAPLDKKTIALVSFSSGDNIYAFIRGFYGTKGPNFFKNRLDSFFQKLIDQGYALVSKDDIVLFAQNKPHIIEVIEQLHQTCSSNNLKIDLKKSFQILLTVNFVGHW